MHIVSDRMHPFPIGMNLHTSRESHSVQDPEHGTPLLEMVPVEVPLRPSEALELCWSTEAQPSEAAIEASMQVAPKHFESDWLC